MDVSSLIEQLDENNIAPVYLLHGTERFLIDEAMRRIKQLVLQQCDAARIAVAATEQGMVTMRDDGLRKVIAGVTTIEEVLRVTQK